MNLTRLFLDNVNHWEETGQYAKLIEFGVQAIEKEQPEGEISASILCSIAASAFYLSHYDNAWTFAETAYQLTLIKNNQEEKVRSLYLKSAICRAKKDFVQALQLIRNAEDAYFGKDVFNGSSLNNEKLYAKILFNELAIYTDGNLGVEPDNALIERLLATYDNINEPIEKARVLIRMANYSLQKNPAEVTSADRYLKMVQTNAIVGQGRIYGQYCLAKGRLNMETKNYPEANNYLFLAQGYANRFNLTDDFKRASDAIEKLTTLIAQDNEWKIPGATLFHQYGNWVKGAAAAAVVAGVAYVMKSRFH